MAGLIERRTETSNGETFINELRGVVTKLVSLTTLVRQSAKCGVKTINGFVTFVATKVIN
jgi:hypothetical protein